jgi:hypothetical protein
LLFNFGFGGSGVNNWTWSHGFGDLTRRKRWLITVKCEYRLNGLDSEKGITQHSCCYLFKGFHFFFGPFIFGPIYPLFHFPSLYLFFYFIYSFHHQFNLIRESVLASSGFSLLRSQLRGSNCGPPYQVQRQLPLNQILNFISCI